MSVSSNGEFGGPLSEESRCSDGGRYVVFQSRATDLHPSGNNGFTDIYRHDILTGVTETVSVSMGASGLANASSMDADVSGDGRYVVWSSQATNLVPGDTNGRFDVFLRDMELGVTERISRTGGGMQSGKDSFASRITPDGRYVVFLSNAALDPGDVNSLQDVYRFDRQLGELDLISVTAAGTQGNQLCTDPELSDDGQRIVFVSSSDSFVAGDTNGFADIFLKDVVTGDLTLISSPGGGVPSNGVSRSAYISGDGHTVAFSSLASNLVPGDTNGVSDAFAFDGATGAMERISVNSTGASSGGGALPALSISADGNLVVFGSSATDLVANDTNGVLDCFLRDRAAGTTERVNLSATGAELNGANWSPSMSADGRFVSYTSLATNIVPGDTGGWWQIFAVDRFGSGDIGTSYCLANPNSTGLTGEISASGSPVVAANDVTLTASQLPASSFGFFLVSRAQSFVPQPGGSLGNLCLGANIGRYIGPGEVQNSGAAGEFQLTVDLGEIPQPTGPVAAIAGDAWNFQAWYRDVSPGAANSNFTNGIEVLLQ